MVVIVVVGVVLIATLCADLLATRRPGDDALLRHERALAALRDVAEHPRPLTVSDRGEEVTLPDEHIRILREPPEGATTRRKRARPSTAASRRTAASRTAARKKARDVVGRPTVASLPTRPEGRGDESSDESPAPRPLVMPIVRPDVRADESPDESSTPAELQVRRLEDRPDESFDESSTPIPFELALADSRVDESSDESSTRLGIPIVGVFGGEFVGDQGPPDPVPAAPHPEPARLPDHPRSVTITRARVLAVAAAAVITIGVSIGTALAIGPHHSGARSSAAPKAAPPAAPSPVTAAAPLTATTATTSEPGVRLLASAAGDGTVTVATPFALNLVASGPCWVGVTTSGGQTVFQGTLRAGDTRAIAGSGELVVRLGNSTVMHLTVNGTQLDLAGVGRTANVKFVPNA